MAASGWATLGTHCFHQGHIQFARNRDRGLLDFAYDLHNVIDTQSIFRQLSGLSVVTAALRSGVSVCMSALPHPPILLDLHLQLQEPTLEGQGKWGCLGRSGGGGSGGKGRGGRAADTLTFLYYHHHQKQDPLAQGQLS